ncbi:M14 family metallopeptidase [Pendulispora albinea]|uniref:M14 family metallopeptidase n=1 Tax=Pendulispora albinea TaxID=2741071 RepID=A0ABZ2LPR0_9BACT
MNEYSYSKTTRSKKFRSITPVTALLAIASVAWSGTCTPDTSLTTIAEESGFQKTGRYDEVIRFCKAYPARYPERVRCFKFGETPEGRPMLAFVAGAKGALEPGKAKDRPVVFLQGGIHAGEVDGKDAGFIVLRDLLDGKGDAAKALENVTLLFVPVFNVDGHERFERGTRPNQRGPEEAGWRSTAHNLNLNRDYLKADAPEMAAVLRLMGEWDPILFADAHVSDGAKFEHDVSVEIEPRLAGAEELRPRGKALSESLLAWLTDKGHLPIDFYPTLLKEDDPTSGFAARIYPPRFSHGYRSLHNRLALLIETHSWKDYATRVRTTKDIFNHLLNAAAEHGGEWLDAAHAADKRTANLGGTTVNVDYGTTKNATTFPFRGYAYQRVPSEISGTLWTIYDETKPEIWPVPVYREVTPTVTATAPKGGYIVPAAYAALVGGKLDLHGVKYSRIQGERKALKVEAYRADEVKFGSPSEGRTPVQHKGKWAAEAVDVPDGSLYVPIKQTKAVLAVQVLEPTAPDSLFAWGFFNSRLEYKENIENYVVEQLAREMIAKDPQLKVEFDAKVASDPIFAKDPAARIEFFYKRTPYWDERYRLYPVYRVNADP